MNEKCPIWGEPAELLARKDEDEGVSMELEKVTYNSPRAGGKYTVGSRFAISLSEISLKDKVKLTSWIVEQNQIGIIPSIDQDLLTEIKSRVEPSVFERADRLLGYIEANAGFLGGTVSFYPNESDNRGVGLITVFELLSFTSSEKLDEVVNLVDLGVEKKWLEKTTSNEGKVVSGQAVFYTVPKFRLKLLLRGYDRLLEINESFQNLTEIAKVRSQQKQETYMDKKRCSSEGRKIFVGHGGSPVWRALKDFIHDRLKLECDEFNRVAVAGKSTTARLSEMLDDAAFAFLVLTAEDEGPGGEKQARMNVVHEVGLFQGRLGFAKAIILMEEDCAEFSNIQGLCQIRFPPGNIASAYEEIREVLEREGLIKPV